MLTPLSVIEFVCLCKWNYFNASNCNIVPLLFLLGIFLVRLIELINAVFVHNVPYAKWFKNLSQYTTYPFYLK